MALAIVGAVTLPVCAQVQSPAELDEIRQQIQDLKKSYETRIQQLEQRLKAAEEAAANAQTAAAKAETAAQQAESTAQKAEASAAQAPAAVAVAGPASQNAFNPGISLILQGSYSTTAKTPKRPRSRATCPPEDGTSVCAASVWMKAS